MKYKKYLLFIMLILLFGIDKAYADTCYYQIDDASLSYDSSTGKFKIEERGANEKPWAPNDPLINNGKSKRDNATGITVEAIASGCPSYVVYRHKSRVGVDSDGIWGFNDYAKAKEFSDASSQINNMGVWLVNKTNITSDEFYSNLKRNKQTSYAVSNNGTVAVDGDDVNIDCGELFGSKNDPKSISYLVNEILKYPKYIVPGLIILLGTLDFLKAVLAGKEDEMKKAQSTFIKRLIIGVAVFLVPVIVNAIMWLADIAWEGLGYTHCGI